MNLLGNLQFCLRLRLVIEAMFESMRVKAEVFANLDAVMPPDAVLATNTSYLDVDTLAEMTADPSRVLGLRKINVTAPSRWFRAALFAAPMTVARTGDDRTAPEGPQKSRQ